MNRRLLGAAGLLFVSACQPDSARSVVPAADTVRMRLAWSVEPGRDAIADSLGDLSGIAQDGGGNIYVSDRQAAKIWIFGPSGRFLRSVGGPGEGPGEFSAPSGPAVSPTGQLYVRDVDRVTILGPGEDGLLTNVETTLAGPLYPDWMSSRATRFDSAGAMLYPGKKWLEDGTSAPYFIRFQRDGTTADTLFVPPQPTTPQLTAFYRTGPGGGRMLPGLNHVPFAPLPVWDITASGTTISGDGDGYKLAEVSEQGATVTVFQRDVAPSRIPKRQRQDSIEALRERVDSIEVPRGEVQGVPEEVWRLDVPDVFPAYQAVYVASDQTIWVRRWPIGEIDQTVFDVFERTGQFRTTAVLDREILVEPTPIITSGGIVGVTRSRLTDEFGIVYFVPSG